MAPAPGLSSMLPPEMEGRVFPLRRASHDGTTPPLPDRPVQQGATLPPVAEVPSPRGLERVSTGNLRNAFWPNVNAQSTVRVVTPEPPTERALDPFDANGSGMQQMRRGFGSMSPQSSPRSIPGVRGGADPVGNVQTSRRQGVVFNDAVAASSGSNSSSPPPRPPSFRPRTHTMDGAFRQQLAPALETRHRVGSFSAASSLPVSEDTRAPPLQPPFESYRPPDLHISTSLPLPKDKKSSSTRSRLTKRPSSRPTSPVMSPPPSVDSLPLPIPTRDANKVLLLMKNLCGRMRGEVEYQRESGAAWFGGLCWIEDEKGSLMFDSGDNGPFHITLVSDLRGCRVLPMDQPGQDRQCLEIVTQPSHAVYIRPLISEELDLWLAALLCWQQLRPAGVRLPNLRQTSTGPPTAPGEMKRRASSSGLRDATIIKVGKVLLWDKGVATTPRAIVKRPSTRDLRSTQTCWRRVSCMLQENGEFKLMTENDVTVLSVIALGQLARSAVQQLDKSVLDEEHCIAIFPIYSSTATQLSIFRPVYISLESRVLFEVWFVLLRAYTIPDVYGLDTANGGQVYDVTDLNAEPPGDVFRMEKTISLRITEAKIRSNSLVSESGFFDRHGKGGLVDPTIGNYLAEVILDGEVRARTTTKTDTKNPFWREDCEFHDLPTTFPYLSVLLKRVDGNLESFSHQLQASLGLPRTDNLTEVLCGCVDIPLHQLERGKDHEQWLPMYDDRQNSVGTMLVKIRHEELVVLLSKDYQPLSELLHRFSSGLTAQITEALPGPGNLRRVAEIFLNIFQVSGRATEWIMNMVEDEIDGIGNHATMKKPPRFSRRLKSNDSMDSTTSDRDQIVRDMSRSLQGEANLLFRGNTLLTQALEFHMRRLGKEYLREVLADKIFEINEINPNCEVDPGKMQHGEDISRHWDQLIRLTTEVWECITSSANRLPPELRHVLKYVRAVAEDRYGDFLRTVTYTSVSGFLFLRFLCPAILNPKLFGLLRDHPRPRAQRALTLIAKGLQALANLSTIGKKETWMEPMNRFLNTQRQSLKDFLDAVCAIPMERTNVMLSASYSTPITILGRLSPLAREGFPSLPYLVDHARNFAALVKLWMDAHPTSASESQIYEGDLLEFHTLCIGLHRRSMECAASIESLRSMESTSQLGGEDYASSIIDAMDHVSLGGHALDMLPSQNTSAIWGQQQQQVSSWLGCGVGGGGKQPPGSSGSDMDRDTTIQFGPSTRETSRQQQQQQRQVSRSNNSELLSSSSHHQGSSQGGGGGGGGGGGSGTVRGLRNGMQARKFLSGFINRKTRTASPDGGRGGAPVGSSPWEQELEQVNENLGENHPRDNNNNNNNNNRKASERGREQQQQQQRNRAISSGLGLLPEPRDAPTKH